ncbi:hypothetical protein SISNIDRAFT_475695 [Sistotremastrum niveocremeum HHB9708]|uniref:Velvet domain-containing protein n=1 Tax=Sistotremastrum niveocremeum HHB9708 TaxID=1314777 RepID=A0A164QA80_9AGAM|nr:hypothetical protein SISNIDRAFT_475695 [Sistotremastrum niveocremeum HHB9708]
MSVDRDYELTVRQEPKQARMCGIGGKGTLPLPPPPICTNIAIADRRPIDPPPIVQLKVLESPSRPSSPSASTTSPPIPPTSPQSFLQNPYYFMFASLASPDNDEEQHLLKDNKTRATTGSDTENGGIDAGFFVFPDLSVRVEGSYRLKLTLFEVIGEACIVDNNA